MGLNILCLDVENGAEWLQYKQNDKDKEWLDLTPFHPSNQLVSVALSVKTEGWSSVENFCVNHVSEPPTPNYQETIQKRIDDCDLMVGHNIKHDIKWLLECGFTIDCKAYDTMIGEYVLQKGIKKPLNLYSLTEEHGLTMKKSDLIQSYMDKHLSMYVVPWSLIDEYGPGDIVSTCELYDLQQERLSEQPHLIPTVTMMCEFLFSLVEMERNGVKIDQEALDKVEKEYKERLVDLERFLLEGAREVMGDGPINLSSPDFCSKLFYSREVLDKKKWKELFNIGTDEISGKPKRRTFMNSAKFNRTTRVNSRVLKVKRGEQCRTCGGRGEIDKYTKAGVLYKKLPKCTVCLGVGIRYIDTSRTAGLRLVPTSVFNTSAAGFAANKDTLNTLKDSVKSLWVREYIEKYIEHSAIETYLSTFVNGINKYKSMDGMLRTNLNQTIASTGRLSSSAPNFQNMPRGKTFPIKLCMVSRFKGGTIMEADYSGLEFRMAGHLSGCPQVRKDIDDPDFDPHIFSRDAINNFDPTLPQIERQNAKPDTFKPLYGGMSGSPRQKAYYKAFLKRYARVAEWHEELKTEAMRTKLVRTPTGREYKFPYARRTASGYVNQSTQIVNYPVQGFATGDVVPVGIIAVWRLFRKHRLQSKMILTVHDSLYVDVFPGEREIVIRLLTEGMLSIDKMFHEFYGIGMAFPIAIEIKEGPNAFDMREIK